MSEIPDSASGTDFYLSVWKKSVCDVLEKIAGSAFSAVDLALPEVAEQAEALSKEGVWLRFTVENALQGEQSFGMGKSDALRLAQILMGEPFNEKPDFSSDDQDALAELFRQFAGTAALALKPRFGGEVSLQFSGYGPANWTPRQQWGVRCMSAGAGAQFLLLVLLNSALGDALDPRPSGKAPAPSGASRCQATVITAPPPKGNRNIDLLLDVELQVALRFGKREMALGDILELSTGSVVELDQKILEPVELLVGGKAVAHGEVVVLDGHYALRVTEVLNPVERLESLAA
jgi:flagellar motor switch protein FliN/FliY